MRILLNWCVDGGQSWCICHYVSLVIHFLLIMNERGKIELSQILRGLQ